MLDDTQMWHQQQQEHQQWLERVDLIGQYACPYCGKHAPEFFFCCKENHAYELTENNIEEYLK